MMNDTMNSMYGSEDIPLFGGNLLGGSLPSLALDEYFQVKQVDDATFMSTAPRGGNFNADDFTYGKLGLHLGFLKIIKPDCILALPSPSDDWMSNKIDLSEIAFDADFNALFQNEKSFVDVKEPVSPAGSFDSGVSSPGFSSTSSEGYADVSQSFCSSPPTDFSALDNTSDDVATILYQNSPVSNVAASADDSQSILTELGIELVADDLPLFDQSAINSKVPVVSIDNNPTELQLLLATSSNQQLLINSPVPAEIAIPVPKSKAGRKNKVSSVQDRKQRKRDQNKNAATRYRERKRQEQLERKGEETALEEKNRTLNDKVNQISREIDYLKELMIEVYRIKGVIQ